MFGKKQESLNPTPSDLLINLRTSIELNKPKADEELDYETIHDRMRELAEDAAAVKEVSEKLPAEEMDEYYRYQKMVEQIIASYEDQLSGKNEQASV